MGKKYAHTTLGFMSNKPIHYLLDYGEFALLLFYSPCNFFFINFINKRNCLLI